MYVCMYVGMYVCMYVYVEVRVCMGIYIYIFRYVYLYLCICTVYQYIWEPTRQYGFGLEDARSRAMQHVNVIVPGLRFSGIRICCFQYLLR